ncbi:TetR/AcrR family transcriptional regulator [Microbacterium sediminicola]
MPKISEEHRAHRRDEILDAAERCFLREGYRRASMAHIIAESGLSAGAIYSYFASKNELVRAVAARVLEARTLDLDSAAVDRILSPAEIARTLIEGLLRSDPTPVLLQIWAEASLDPEVKLLAQDVLRALRATVTQRLVAWATASTSIEDPEGWAIAATPVLLAVVPGFVVQRTLVDDFEASAFMSALPSLIRAE